MIVCIDKRDFHTKFQQETEKYSYEKFLQLPDNSKDKVEMKLMGLQILLDMIATCRKSDALSFKNLNSNIVVILLQIMKIGLDEKSLREEIYTEAVFHNLLAALKSSLKEKEILKSEELIALFKHHIFFEYITNSIYLSSKRIKKNDRLSHGEMLDLKIAMRVLETTRNNHSESRIFELFYEVLEKIEDSCFESEAGCSEENFRCTNKLTKSKTIDMWKDLIENIEDTPGLGLFKVLIDIKNGDSSRGLSSSAKLSNKFLSITLGSSGKRQSTYSRHMESSSKASRSSERRRKTNSEDENEFMDSSPVRLLDFDNISVKENDCFLNKKRHETFGKVIQTSSSKSKRILAKVIPISNIKPVSILKKRSSRRKTAATRKSSSGDSNSTLSEHRMQNLETINKITGDIFTKDTNLFKQNHIKVNTTVNGKVKQSLKENEKCIHLIKIFSTQQLFIPIQQALKF